MASSYFDQPPQDVLQPLADIFGLTYGTWSAVDLTLQGQDLWISIAGWSQAISAFLWWFTDLQPASLLFNTLANGFALFTFFYGNYWTSDYWYAWSFACGALAVDVFHFVMYFLGYGSKSDDLGSNGG